jgi:hypothetical protein
MARQLRHRGGLASKRRFRRVPLTHRPRPGAELAGHFLVTAGDDADRVGSEVASIRSAGRHCWKLRELIYLATNTTRLAVMPRRPCARTANRQLVDARGNNTDVISWRDATSSTQTPSR